MMDTSTLNNFVALHTKILAAVKPHVWTYFTTKSPGSRDRSGYYLFDETTEWNLTIDADGVSFSAEYNDSCNCHPEYVTFTDTIPWTVVQKMMDGDTFW